MWRHGDRTPITLLPNDAANDEESWEIGLGELTVEGIWQAYHLGKFLRERYDGFLSETFKTSEVSFKFKKFSNITFFHIITVLNFLSIINVNLHFLI